MATGSWISGKMVGIDIRLPTRRPRSTLRPPAPPSGAETFEFQLSQGLSQ